MTPPPHRVVGRGRVVPVTAAVLLGAAADAALGDPRRGHPVAQFGRWAAWVEGRLYPDGAPPATLRRRGLAHLAATAGVVTAGVAAVDLALRRRPVARTAWGAAVVWSCLGARTLDSVGSRQARLLADGDVAGARELLPWLCGRDPSGLDSAGLARAVVESVAENTSDAVVCTLFWAAVAGPAGAAGHRCVNTLDAMVGHLSPRYRDFGRAAARCDDLLGWPAARLAGVLSVAAAPVVAGSPRGALRVWRQDAAAHPSPNAGVVEATCAGALGVRLGGTTPYPYGVQERSVLGTGRTVGPADVRRAVRLEATVQLLALGAAVVTSLVLRGPRPRLGQGRRSSASRSRPRCARRRSAWWREP